MQNLGCISLSGGQGKTSTIFFTSLLLAKAGKRVLAIDADPQANLTFFLNHDVGANDPTLYEVLAGKVEALDGVYPTRYDNLYLMPADRSLFKISEYLSSSGTGAFILKLRLKSLADMFDFAFIDIQPSRSQICLAGVGASNQILIPVEANTKGLNSLIDTMSFLDEQTSLSVFTGQVIGILPFRDRWVGLTQTIESRDSIEAMKDLGLDIPLLPSIKESEQFKRALRSGKLVADLGYDDLQYPFEQIIKRLLHE